MLPRFLDYFLTKISKVFHSSRRKRVEINVFLAYTVFLLTGWINYEFLKLAQDIPFLPVALYFGVECIYALLIIVLLMLVQRTSDSFRPRLWSQISDFGWLALPLYFYLDYAFFHILSIHMWDVFCMVCRSPLAEWTGILSATGVRKEKIAGIVCVLILLLFLSSPLVELTRKFSRKWPLSMSQLQLILISSALLAVLVLETVIRQNIYPTRAYRELARVMPLCLDRSSPPPALISFQAHLRPVPNTEERERAVARCAANLMTGRPDIFLFIIESLRKDAVDFKTAPHFTQFASESFTWLESISAGNATHLGWYSVLTANHPMYLRTTAERRELWGALPLRLFQKLGYSIHVFSGSRLDYRNLDRIIFGANHDLAASFVVPETFGSTDPSNLDQRTIEILCHRIKESPGSSGKLFLIFLESTHHDYSWPSDFPAVFYPYAKTYDYMSFQFTSDEINQLKNRYRNAVHFVDDLFGKVISALKESGSYDKAIITVTGDHGEEFMEFGRLLHANDLNYIQTSVPIYLKFPKDARCPGSKVPTTQLITQIDILPSILHFLGFSNDTSHSAFNGRSIFANGTQFGIVAAANGGDDPCRFYIHNGLYKAFFTYRNSKVRIAFEDFVYLEKITDGRDRTLELAQPQLREFVNANFAFGLRDLFLEIPF